ncbi:sulfite exporter TauE/SafE family protein [Pseudomonas oryzihabitans]|uniref:sulfite exporter TauE/SafE family protein n=1 Tax=Pseudomonas oryzihabitans TaxID=47885 RepID=UPI0009DD04FA|nr:sulfite exporter TauE/SafE family protein [Pseudomonas oryzihabitans]NMZ45600.1 sulfite exporter TauE/SafE family protein [Pseudomonas oryzihabitans]
MTLLLCILIFVLAGLTKGVLGLGLPTVAMSLLALLMTPAEAAALLLIPSLLTNVWQCCAGPSPWPTFTRLLPLQLALVPGTLLSIPLLTGGDGAGLAAALGAVLVAYGLVGWTGWRLPAPGRHEGKVAPLVGFVTGLITGMTGVFVLPAVPYLQSLALDREQLIEALGLTFTVATLALLMGLWWQDALAVERLRASSLLLLPALLGMALGQRLRQRLDERLFRRLFFGGLLLLGAYAVLHYLLRLGYLG